MMATHAKLKRHNKGAQDLGQLLGGNTGESCTLDAMPGIDDSYLREWVGNGRENENGGGYAAENIKESAMQDTSAWIVPLSLVMTVAFAEVLNLPQHIASETPDGFRGEHEFRRVCVVLYALCFLTAGFNVMRIAMSFTVRLITLAQTPAYLTAKLLRKDSEKRTGNPFQRCIERLMRLFCITIDHGQSFVEPNLFLMGIGYSIGLYLTQGWEVAVSCLLLVCAVYPSLRDTVHKGFAERYGSGGPHDYAKGRLSKLERELESSMLRNV